MTHSVITEFNSSESWSVLTDMERSIKAKIEAVGTPLKEWDISINYGIKTGFNDAFIIDSTKRKQILSNCQTEEERIRTEAIIRPILRGRDVARYKYNWADLWLINTHNGIKGKFDRIHIEDYPAIKQHLDYYWDKIESRADKGDTPYNLRNCAYMDEFSKTKIIYPNMTKFLPFVLDTEGFLTNQKCFIMTGEKLGFLTAFLNSSLFKFCFANKFPELQGKTRELSKIFMDEIPVIRVTLDQEQKFADLVKDIQNDYSKEKAINIDKQIFELYGLDIEEQSYIGFIDFREN